MKRCVEVLKRDHVKKVKEDRNSELSFLNENFVQSERMIEGSERKRIVKRSEGQECCRKV